MNSTKEGKYLVTIKIRYKACLSFVLVSMPRAITKKISFTIDQNIKRVRHHLLVTYLVGIDSCGIAPLGVECPESGLSRPQFSQKYRLLGKQSPRPR